MIHLLWDQASSDGQIINDIERELRGVKDGSIDPDCALVAIKHLINNRVMHRKAVDGFEWCWTGADNESKTET